MDEARRQDGTRQSTSSADLATGKVIPLMRHFATLAAAAPMDPDSGVFGDEDGLHATCGFRGLTMSALDGINARPSADNSSV